MLDLSLPTYGKAAITQQVSAAMPSPPQPTVQSVSMPAIVTDCPPAPMPTSTAPAIPAATTDLLDAPDDWDWKQLRDYVMRQVQERHGPQPRGDEIRIASTFQSFHKRWGALAGPIARFAFEQQDGFWRSAPVTATRFTKGSDPYFAEPIAQRLTGATT